jgi:neurexin
MIIGIVAGALIAVILVILLVLWIKSNGDRSYKMEHDLKYGHGANAALLGHNAGNSGHHSNVHHAGSGGSGNNGAHHGNNNNNSGGHHMNQHHNQHYNNQPYQQGNGYNQSSGYDAHDGGAAGHHSPSMGLNGSLRHQQGGGGSGSHYDRNGMSAGLVQPKAKRNSKDIKEWYV